MKICYLADAGSVHTQRWVKYFADKGHEVHLISFISFGECNIKNVKLHQIKKSQSKMRIIRILSFLARFLSYMVKIRKLKFKVMGHLPFRNAKGSLVETAFIFINSILNMILCLHHLR